MRLWSGARRLALRVAVTALLLLPSYALLAYVLLPAAWKSYEKRLPRPAGLIASSTAEGIPADPLNFAIVGTRGDVCAAMRAAGWVETDRITFRSGLRDLHSVLLDRPYASAPVSTHFLWNRPQDLAFERTEGRSPRRRHHIRLWRADAPSKPGETLWIGAATFDAKMGVSRFTGELMHHISPDVDRERERLLSELERAGSVRSSYRLEKFRPAGTGRNGAGDEYRTDGQLLVVVVKPTAAAAGSYSSISGKLSSRSDRS